MNWILFASLVWALNIICKGQLSRTDDYRLSESGYHLCKRNETKTVSYVVQYLVPYTVTRQCGGWIPWKTCQTTEYAMTQYTEYKTVTEQVTRCCEGYTQVGHYCALTVNRSREITAKPGSCPNALGLYGSKGCEWDMDCLGWQKCCQTWSWYVCTDPTGSAYVDGGVFQFNATVTIKVDYEELMSREKGVLNHTRLLYAMVIGVLDTNASIYYLSSQPVYPYRTATSLLLRCESSPTLDNVTFMLHRLLKHVQEVSSVTVEDIDECAQPFLHRCSSHTDCVNTVGSYYCTCRPGYTDVDSTKPGTNCTALSTVPPPITSFLSMNTNSTVSSQTSVCTTLNGTTYAPTTNTSETSTSSNPCSVPSITKLRAANVTSSSFRVFWSSQFPGNQSYSVALSKRAEVVFLNDTSQTMLEMRGLQAGVLYDVSVTPYACGRQGNSSKLTIKTDARTLNATARITNEEYTTDLKNASSASYLNLSTSIYMEIYWSLSKEMRALVDSGHVRIMIAGFAPGSVVVNFTLVFVLSPNEGISDVSSAVINALKNSSKYDVDTNSTEVNDHDECLSGENDCSPFANCTNTWASYTCVCLEGLVDDDLEMPGRYCQESVTTTLGTTDSNQLHTTNQHNMLTLESTSKSTESTTPLTTQTVMPTSEPSVITTIPIIVIPVSSTTTPLTIATVALSTVSSTTKSAGTTTTAASSVTSTTASTTNVLTTTTAASTTATASKTTSIAALTTHAAALTTTAAVTTATEASTTNTNAPINSRASTTAKTGTSTSSDDTTTIISAAMTTTAALTTTTVSSTSTTGTNITTTVPPTTTAGAILTTAATTKIAVSPTSTTEALTTSSLTTTTVTTSMATTTMATTTTKLSSTSTAASTSSTTTTTAFPTTKVSPLTTAGSATTQPEVTTTTTSIASGAVPSVIKTTKISASKAIAVKCNVASITVTVAREFLQSSHIKEASLYLGMADCGVNGGNATHAQLTVAWNKCNTSLIHNDSYYTASITLFNSMNSSNAMPVPRLEIPVICTYMKSMLITSDFGSVGYDMIKDVIAGSGMFQVSVQLMNGTVPLPHNFSLSPSEAVVVVVSLNTSADTINVVINKCWATPTSNPSLVSKYIFMENRCSINPYTTVISNGNSSTSSLSVQIFSFVDLNMIYLHCQVEICVQIGSTSCAPDCLQKTLRSGSRTTVGRALGSFGPLYREEDDAQLEGYDTASVIGLSCLGVGLSIFFIVGFVCLFYYQRNRIGHYNFSNNKPREENFTYLTFST